MNLFLDVCTWKGKADLLFRERAAQGDKVHMKLDIFIINLCIHYYCVMVFC